MLIIIRTSVYHSYLICRLFISLRWQFSHVGRGWGTVISTPDKRFSSTDVEVSDAGAMITTDRNRRLANCCYRLRSASTNQLWRRGWKSHYRRCCSCYYPMVTSTSRIGFRRARPIFSWCAVFWTIQSQIGIVGFAWTTNFSVVATHA